jgi:hypothetical protein
MAKLIDLYRPSRPSANKGVLTAYRPVAPIIAAIGTAAELRERVEGTRFDTISGGRLPSYSPFCVFAHTPGMADFAGEMRNKLLPYFVAANQAHNLIAANNSIGIERKIAVAMVSAMLGALGAKGDKEALGGMIELIEGDAVARATGLWQPLNLTPAILAIACRKLIATSKFVPKPTELADACREAGREVARAECFCDELVDSVRRSDALLLEFAPDQWRAPYQLPQYQAIVQRMLELHETWGNGDEQFFAFADEDDEYSETEKNRNFRLALDRAKAEFPSPQLIEQKAAAALTDQTSKPALAACAKPPAKKTKRGDA